MGVKLLNSLPEAAEEMSTTVRTLHRLAKKGDITILKMGRRSYIAGSDLEKYVDTLRARLVSAEDAGVKQVTTSELVLTESRTMRDRTIDRVDVLGKVKALAMLPDDLHVTTDMVADYFEVDVEAIKKTIQRNRSELQENGLRTLRGSELAEVRDNLSLTGARHFTLFSRRAVLNVGQLLRDSDVARKVRTYLLEVEELAAPAQRVAAVDKATLAEAQLRAVGVAKQFGLVNSSYLEGVTRTLLARMTGEEPDVDPQDITVTADEYLTDHGVALAALRSARTRLGKTVAALYRARYGKDPQKIKRLVSGVHRDVAVYTHRDLDLFDTAWAELSRHYDVQGVLTTT